MTMKFKARELYKDETVVRSYDNARFTSIKGWLTDRLEKQTIDKAFTFAGFEMDAMILDVPCGTGRLSLHLAQKGFRVTGIDISAAMVGISQEKAESSDYSERLAFEVADAENLQFADNSFDTVVSLRLFGHVPPAIRANMLAEFKRICRGNFVLAYYHSKSFQCILRRKKRTKADIPWYPVTFDEIKKELEIARLTLVKIFPMALGFSETLVVLARRS